MTVKELKEYFNGQFDACELYRFRDNIHEIHADNIIAVDDLPEETPVCEYKLMNEEEYNHTVYAHSAYTANFEDYCGRKDAKVLVIVVAEGRY